MISANAKFRTNNVDDSHSESSNPCLFRIFGVRTAMNVSKLPRILMISNSTPSALQISNPNSFSIFYSLLSNIKTTMILGYQEIINVFVYDCYISAEFLMFTFIKLLICRDLIISNSIKMMSRVKFIRPFRFYE